MSEITRAGIRARLLKLKKRLWLIALVALFSLGALGAVLKSLEDSARESKLKGAKDTSILGKINPFSPPPTPTPQLSKENVYAGSRLLAVVDANAQEVPPADLAVWRPSSGYWYVLGGPGSAQTFFQFGNNTDPDIPVPGDYDGDGKTDFSVFRPSTGTWWESYSSNGTTVTSQFGSSGVTPVPADFDGDGKTDAAYFKTNDPSSGNATFYIKKSTDLSYYSVPFGLSTDVPAPADYDGDGKADIAVFRPSTNTFYSVNSSNGAVQTIPMGSIAGSTVVSADYDGDGKADYAIFNSSTWYIRNSTSGTVSSTAFGSSGDFAVQNDYDADGRCDIAIWRPSTGVWWIRNSHDGSLRTETWGMNGDTPVPALYRR